MPAAGSWNIQAGSDSHRISSLKNTSTLVLYTEPLFYTFSLAQVDDPYAAEKSNALGWHKQKMTDNVAYADGSARTTTADTMIRFDDQPGLLDQMGFSPQFRGSGTQSPETFLRRGKFWQTDAYPTPASVILGEVAVTKPDPVISNGWTGWPFDGRMTLRFNEY